MPGINLEGNKPSNIYYERFTSETHAVLDIFECFPSQTNPSLDSNTWKIRRTRTLTSQVTGEIDSIEIGYPDGLTAYSYAVNECAAYNYQPAIDFTADPNPILLFIGLHVKI